MSMPDGERIINADGTYRIVSAASSGVSSVFVLANGDATIALSNSATGDSFPSGTYGETTFKLKDGYPREFKCKGHGIDQLVITLAGASEVLASWEK